MEHTLPVDAGGGVLRGTAARGVRATASQPPPAAEAGDSRGREPADPGAAGRGLRKLAGEGAGDGGMDCARDRVAESGAIRSATRGLPLLKAL